ncbi:uncharacterized protein DS421_2g44280 [Arachis hypogaea]|nr:uncharacterized protein DS421_2g44280 [Arachis hypogaea]
MADDEEGEGNELLLIGSFYEGAPFVLFEMLVYKLREALDQTPEAVRSHHTNLE